MNPTIATLGQKVKAKYPGQYDDLDDAELGRKVKAKYPGAYDDFADQATPTSSIPGMEKLGALPAAGQPPKVDMQQSVMGKIPSIARAGADLAVSSTQPVATGFGKEVVKQIAPAFGMTPGPQYEPQGTAENLGAGVLDAAEYLAPSGMIAKGAKALDTATRGMKYAPLLRGLGRAGMEGASAGTVAGIQSGGDLRAMRNAALAAGGTSAALGAIGAAVPALKKTATEVLGKTTGAGASATTEALENPNPAFKAAMRGQVGEMDILDDFKDALQNVKDARAAQYQNALAQIPQNQTLDLTPLRKETMSALDSHGVKVSPQGLDFSRSTIRDAAAQNEVKGIVNDIANWGSQPGDLSPLGVDTLKRRIDDFYSPSSNARAFVQRLKGTTRSIVNQTPGYQKMTSDYAAASQFLDQIKDLSLDSKNPGTAIRKLTTTLNQNNNYRQVLVDALDQYSNADLKSQLAGLALNKWTPRGIMGPASGIGLIAAIASGHLTPGAAAALALSSPRIMGEVLSGMSQLKPLINAGGGAASVLAPKIAAMQAASPTEPQLTSPETQ